MRHLIFNNSTYPRSGAKIGGAIAAFALVLAVTVFGQDAVPPPPPDSQQSPQPSLQEPPEPNNVRAVRISDVEGKVQVFNGSESAFDQALQNMPVVEGMRFVTADDGRVEIQFEDGSVARITPNSSITLAQLSRNPDGSTVTTIDTNNGLTYYELNGRAGQYAVRFGPDVVTPTDSAIFRVNLDRTPADLAVTHGTVHIIDGQNLAQDVHTNQSVRIEQGSGQYQLAQSVAADTWDQWNSDRDQALATLEENATAARASTGNPDDAAWNDLDYYGDWYNVPGYGMGWAPSGTGTDWDPFGVGSWGYYNNVGYTWISAYPWGWWPYHCGAWNWFGGYGWMWFPGNCGFGGFGGGWYPYAAVWRCPPGYRPPLRPVNGPRGLPPHQRFPHPQPLVAVNRGPQFGNDFRTVGGVKPTARAFNYDGRSIAPAESLVRVRTAGPIGESFTTAVTRTSPGVLDHSAVRVATPGLGLYRPGVGGRSGYVPPPTAYRPAPMSMPPRTVYTPSAPPHISAPVGGGVHVSAPPPAPVGGHPR